MSRLKLTVACGDYDIVRPLKEGLVQADGLDLVFLCEMGPRERHWRMGRKHEFDVCEENVGAYFMIRDRGQPLAAIPVFLHRRFRHGFVFVNTAAGIAAPKDLGGRFVGGTNFQPAASIWIRGILQEHYGLDHRSITWLVERSEDVAFTPPPGLRIEMKKSAKPLSDMLADGDIAAMISPTLPRPFVHGDKRIARLFPNYKDVELAYFKRHRHFSDHACHYRQAGDRRQISVGRHQSGQGVRAGEAAGLSPASPIRAWCRSPSCAPRSRSRRLRSARTHGPTD